MVLQMALVLAVIASGLYPHVAKILKPPKTFIEVSGGVIEKSLEANELKYCINRLLCLDANETCVLDTSYHFETART